MSNIVSTTLEDRVTLVLREAGEIYGMWKRLEDQTGIAAARWRKAYTAQQRPTPDMVQAICRLKPQFAFWVATGITDAENGHKAPASALPFPEWRSHRASDQAAIDYFMVSLGLLDVLSAQGNVDGGDQEDRLEAFGLRRMKRHWVASPLAHVASEIAAESGAYKQLKGLHKVREALRARDGISLAKRPPKTKRTSPSSDGRVDPLTEQLNEADLFWSRP